MSKLENAILRTVLYADVFGFAMIPEEIQHYLIHDTPTKLADIQHCLSNSALLTHTLSQHDGYVATKNHASLIATRKKRTSAANALFPLAVRYGGWLARIPYVRMVALTGALAVKNAGDGDDDLDYLLITEPGRVWMARAFAIVIVRLLKRRGVVICPNYVLALDKLYQPKQDLFMAHEVVQMVPLYGFDMYDAMRSANSWTYRQLPNALVPFFSENEGQLSRLWSGVKRGLEVLLGGKIGDTLESWEYRRKLHRFQRDMQTPHSSAQLDDGHVKGHFNDHGYYVLQAYRERLEQYDLDEHTMLSLAGD